MKLELQMIVTQYTVLEPELGPLQEQQVHWDISAAYSVLFMQVLHEQA